MKLVCTEEDISCSLSSHELAHMQWLTDWVPLCDVINMSSDTGHDRERDPWSLSISVTTSLSSLALFFCPSYSRFLDPCLSHSEPPIVPLLPVPPLFQFRSLWCHATDAFHFQGSIFTTVLRVGGYSTDTTNTLVSPPTTHTQVVGGIDLVFLLALIRPTGTHRLYSLYCI